MPVMAMSGQASIPIQPSAGVTIGKAVAPGIREVHVDDPGERFNLPWERFMRLKVVSDHLRRLVVNPQGAPVLDVGGFDGALAMFLPGFAVHLLDSATTGGCGTQISIPDRAYEYVVSIDTIEHLPQQERPLLLDELARVCAKLCLINFPNKATARAQEVVAAITGSSLIREHVELGLPERGWVIEHMQKLGFSCMTIPNTSSAIWIAQSSLTALAPTQSSTVNRLLNELHNEEPFTVPLYHLIICERSEATLS